MKNNGVHVLQIKQTTMERNKAVRAKEEYRKRINVEPKDFSWQKFLDVLLDSFEKHRRK